MARIRKQPADRPAGGGQGRLAGTAKWAADRYARTRQRLDRTAAGRLQRRVVEIDLMNQALILAALALMLIIPLLISIAALVPLGDPAGVVAALARRVGLTPDATRDLQQLFPARNTVRGDTTWLGVVISLVSSFAWPAALQRGYELAWRQPSLGWRDLWRPLVWLVGFVALVAIVVSMTSLVRGWVGAVVVSIPLVVVVFLWAWWSQYLLLGGRVGGRLLAPGAVMITVGLFGMRLFADAFLARSISAHYHRYGPLGIVFMLLSWFVAFGVVLLAGAMLGAELHEHRRRRAAGTPRA